MSEPYVSEIRLFSFPFAPKGWAICDGSTLNIQQNVALYSLIGIFYGGDGKTTFCLPDLRGRVAVHRSLTDQNFALASKAGVETVVLNTTQVPIHTHQVLASSVDASSNPPQTNDVFANTNAPGTNAFYSNPTQGAQVALNPAGVSSVGGQAHNNMQPFLVGNYCISLQGVYPQRP